MELCAVRLEMHRYPPKAACNIPQFIDFLESAELDALLVEVKEEGPVQEKVQEKVRPLLSPRELADSVSE